MSSHKKFYTPDGKPSFEHCICVFMDVLGSVERQKSLQAEAALEEFQQFYSVISREVQNMNKWGAGTDEDSFWRLKVFTDNILLGYPLNSNELLHAEPEVFLRRGAAKDFADGPTGRVTSAFV